VILNLGGIANVTWLPAAGRPEDVIAFDVGPANAWLDAVVQLASGGAERFDREGARAERGRCDPALLDELLRDEFLRRAPPKSTGRERYGVAEAEAWFSRSQRDGRSTEDLLATLVAFSAEAVAQACRDFLPGPVERLIVGGGGARNPALMAALAARLPGSGVDVMDAHGVPAAAAEAMAFALLGRNARLGLANQLPRCTGAVGARVLGEFVPGASGRLDEGVA
jgi:anhydro-N-acetylmuramic acid kinase